MAWEAACEKCNATMQYPCDVIAYRHHPNDLLDATPTARIYRSLRQRECRSIALTTISPKRSSIAATLSMVAQLSVQQFNALHPNLITTNNGVHASAPSICTCRCRAYLVMFYPRRISTSPLVALLCFLTHLLFGFREFGGFSFLLRAVSCVCGIVVATSLDATYLLTSSGPKKLPLCVARCFHWDTTHTYQRHHMSRLYCHVIRHSVLPPVLHSAPFIAPVRTGL